LGQTGIGLKDHSSLALAGSAGLPE
ncbi:MAG: hypothetical protein JWR60_1388, partial [Polaromonas sp.]|nr:hypothetical protein [Polaromonas sp.]